MNTLWCAMVNQDVGAKAKPSTLYSYLLSLDILKMQVPQFQTHSLQASDSLHLRHSFSNDTIIQSIIHHLIENEGTDIKTKAFYGAVAREASSPCNPNQETKS